jgi:hypothetical protein
MRQYVVTPSEIIDWWGAGLNNAARLAALKQEQRNLLQKQRTWATRTRWLYDAGLLCLLLALPTMLVPRRSLKHISDWRLAVIALALLGFLAELVWTVSAAPRRRAS